MLPMLSLTVLAFVAATHAYQPIQKHFLANKGAAVSGFTAAHRVGNSYSVHKPHSSRLFEKEEDSGDKLVYDTKSNRFYEANTNEFGEEEFCLMDESTGKPILLTREEKERIFLDSIQSYYFSGKNILTDKQFDRLREDLVWEGSILVNLNRNETLFLNAMQVKKSFSYGRENELF